MSNRYGHLPSVIGEFAEIPFVYRKICFPLPAVEMRLADEVDARWYEVGFTCNGRLTGDATTGWVDAAGEISWRLQSSDNLTTWLEDEMLDCAVTDTENFDGTWTYWARRQFPLYWKSVIIDLTVGTDRYGKSITGITLFQTPITSGMSYPYAMPSQAADLQADLRAAGYTGTLVTTSSGTLTASAKNYLSDGTKVLVVTQSGADVTSVRPYDGSTISLPAYPYTMPGSRAALQSALRANGYPGAVVMLRQDPWEIFIPDRPATGQVRDITVHITPDDPFPGYDMFGNSVGEVSTANQTGGSGNVRSVGLTSLAEANRAFFRLKMEGTPI